MSYQIKNIPFELDLTSLDVNKLESLSSSTKQMTLWQEDRAFTLLAFYSKDKAGQLIDLKDFKVLDWQDKTLDKSSIDLSLNQILATAANPDSKGFAAEGTALKASLDVISHKSKLELKEEVTFASLQVNTKGKIKAGKYSLILFFENQKEEQKTLEFKLNILDLKLDKKRFGLELWQYPSSLADYYKQDLFSQENLDALKSSLELYKSLGGDTIIAPIVEDPWDGQTYSSNQVHVPSMVTWHKTKTGFSYDFSHLKTWLSLATDIVKPERITLYSICPWHGSIGYWNGSNRLVYQKFNLSKKDDQAIWQEFLLALMSFLEEHGWLEITYLGIDERGFDQEVMDFIYQTKNDKGQSLKISGSMDQLKTHKHLAEQIDLLSVSAVMATKEQVIFNQILTHRQNQAKKTYLYSCTGQAPGQFSLSHPIESFWAILDAKKRGADGFLRWAFDAWVKEPLIETSHRLFEAGDCFLVFPDTKEAGIETRWSLRLAYMDQALGLVNKLAYLKENMPMWAKEIDSLYQEVRFKTRYNQEDLYLSASEKKEIIKETKQFQDKAWLLMEKIADQV